MENCKINEILKLVYINLIWLVNLCFKEQIFSLYDMILLGGRLAKVIQCLVYEYN